MDDDTRQAIDAWVAAGNEITKEQPEVEYKRPATRTGCATDKLSHVHVWRLTSSEKFKCDLCGSHGYQYQQRLFTTGNATPQKIVEYTCFKEGCTGWAKTTDNFGRWLCSEHS